MKQCLPPAGCFSLSCAWRRALVMGVSTDSHAKITPALLGHPMAHTWASCTKAPLLQLPPLPPACRLQETSILWATLELDAPGTIQQRHSAQMAPNIPQTALGEASSKRGILAAVALAEPITATRNCFPDHPYRKIMESPVNSMEGSISAEVQVSLSVQESARCLPQTRSSQLKSTGINLHWKKEGGINSP